MLIKEIGYITLSGMYAFDKKQELEKMKQRIYVDTSVIGGCEDEEFSRWSIQSHFPQVSENF
jgi:hypothetical protein